MHLKGFFLKHYSKYKKKIFLIGVDLYVNTIKKNIFETRIKSPSPKNIAMYKKFIFETIKRYKVKLIIPCSDEEAHVLSLYKGEFEKLNCIILVKELEFTLIYSDLFLLAYLNC